MSKGDTDASMESVGDTRDSAVRAMLLQQHSYMLNRRTFSTLTNRGLFSIFIVSQGFLPNALYSVVLCLAGGILTWFWSQEVISNGRQLRALEETLARFSGGSWEDVYIKSRQYVRQPSVSLFSGFLLEPILWTYLLIGSAVFFYILRRLSP